MTKKNHSTALIVFLLGIFMGAIDSGIVSPARTIISRNLNVDENLGVWMITIYTLSYAVSMPISSKLSDRYGRKKVYNLSILIFVLGSTLCGLNNFFGNFKLLLFSRIIQAFGGGGIMPIATAMIGQSFSKEKRGTALGLVGSIYGIATILGPTLGSTILNIAGNDHWGWIFFINIPISIIILILSKSLVESKSDIIGPLDLKGSVALSIVIVSLMYALTNMNFFHFKESIKSTSVYPFLLIFIIILPIFILIEQRAEDPILNLKYFRNKEILLTLIISFIVGIGLMGVVFIPQFAENMLKIKTGSGGYLVTLMAIFSGISAPLGGKIIDKYSAKIIMSIGFICTIIGALFLGLFVTSHLSFINIFIGLAFMGFGMGFTMGTPLNYLMLSYVSQDESASALSTLSLIRSIGVTISPNIMVNFIVEASKNVTQNIKMVMPSLNIPKSAGNIDISKAISPDMIDKFKSADVSTIVDKTKEFSASMIDKMIPHGNSFAVHFKADYLNKIEHSRATIEHAFQNTINVGFKHMFIASSILACIGLLFTIMLHSKNIKTTK
ncbi:MFS transporter [Clostridium botulinum]|uniref:Permease n=1 Tax=Clostridium botulinum C/D str. DC5 TaxID=1443128 RepID=A0A0A0IE64_CLOBO|nr:MFS transporter [Clostridium botulinum]KEI04603.1 permease [Clostridium botulinum C/D str. BKT75002]KEI06056.1 permease [Clostridium botulinum C/D str. BKT2873]KGM93737.1 permease [Clostridium botulinum D str. CCUG 7971]KGM98783.1 permease [Clostridium botulinum C/D str. DC5]KOC49777.1 permease [Clostridium botulinum]